MTVINLDKTSWTQVNSAMKRVQVFGGRAKVADSDTPDANDFQVWREGEVVDVASAKYAQAVDSTPTWIVTLDI